MIWTNFRVNIISFVAIYSIAGCVKPEECKQVETAYGHVIPYLEYFVTHRITGTVVCQNGDRQSRGFEVFPRLPECPSDTNSEDYLSVQMEINSACINYFHLQKQVSKWLVTDLFGSALVLTKDFTLSAECKIDSTEVSFDTSIYGDLRRVFNNSSYYVQIKLDNIKYSDESFNSRNIVAVLEPVWDFIGRSLTIPNDSTFINVDASGSEGKRLIVETSRGKSVTIDVHYTNSGLMIVELLAPLAQPLPTRSSECDECIDRIPHAPRDCLDTPLTNSCGAITNTHCAAEWAKLKTVCPMCEIPL
jgi:hypothetical protein